MKDKSLVWTSIVTEIFPGKFQLTVIDSSHFIFWHRHCFTSFERAEKFSLKASRQLHSYFWLSEYGEAVDWFVFNKFFLMVTEEIIYRHWVISITELVGDFCLTLHDPWGFKIDLGQVSMDDFSEEDAVCKCRLHIDSVEFSRNLCPGQLSLFEVQV
ncbi:MAG: hypothetical protein V7L26_17525 [Nostoc sp.]|uniref:hypothetical protein n=1 Tax=Nostoc sp. TaxID=1180 RepID=UPI002FF79F91